MSNINPLAYFLPLSNQRKAGRKVGIERESVSATPSISKKRPRAIAYLKMMDVICMRKGSKAAAGNHIGGGYRNLVKKMKDEKGCIRGRDICTDPVKGEL